MPQPACSIPARITASAASSPASPQPSDRAASAARRPISAAFSRASASKSPPFRPPAPRAHHRRRPRGLASQIFSFTSAICSMVAANSRMPGHLAAHLLHLRRPPAAGRRSASPGGPGPQEPRPVTGMIRLRARAVRLPALAVVLAHRPAAEVTDRAELRIQPVPLGLQLRKRRLGHGHPSSGCESQPDSHHNQPRCGTPTYVSHTLSTPPRPTRHALTRHSRPACRVYPTPRMTVAPIVLPKVPVSAIGGAIR